MKKKMSVQEALKTNDVKNITLFRQVLIQSFVEFKNGEISLKEMREINRTARNVIDTCKAEIAYQYVRKISNRIDFMETNGESAMEINDDQIPFLNDDEQGA